MDAYAKSQLDSPMYDEVVEAPPIVRFDERRMHIRAYNYWASLLNDRNLPSIEDLNPSEIEDFGSHSVLLDFTGGMDDPAIAFMGTAIAAQCDLDGPIGNISEIPPRTLLSRLTDHYLQIIANAAPIGFEAEFTNQRGNEILYRGIMMPFSSNDEDIDFVYGVINWKEVVNDTVSAAIVAEALEQATTATVTNITPLWDRALEIVDEIGEDEEGALELTLDDQFQVDVEASLDDCLAAARDAAAAANASEGRTRHALYRAIGLAHAFALAARSRPQDYEAILEDAGIVAHPRSPMTALAKLVFGATYDKTRVAEFVCAIDYALEQDLAPGALIGHLHELPGGLKALVGAYRAAKRGEIVAPAGPSRATVLARRALAKVNPVANAAFSADEAGLAIVVMRREDDGSYVPVAALDHDDKLAERVLAAAARKL
ncbi:MAG: hypothetical protein J7498_08155 [Sphingobium sp.]|nr:hypothetical protein [Sphingobium sp.]